VDKVRGGSASLAGEDARHLGQVLRAEPGQLYELSDNRAVYLAEIEAVRKDEVRFRILEELAAEGPPLRLTLFLALIKFDRFEWAVEKATELGAEAIIPVAAARSEKGLEQAAVKRMERWRKVARESSQQSRRAHLPEIGAPVTFAQALGAPGACRYFLDESGDAPLLAALPLERTPGDEVRLLVGPEGGWTDAERECARQASWTPASLGPAILRAETAAVAATAVLVSAWACMADTEPPPAPSSY
jgi:16S rRNA (uracil1498-N3)-methyltransferase